MFNLTEEEMSNLIVQIIRELARQKGYTIVKQPPSEVVQAIKDDQEVARRKRLADLRKKLVSSKNN